MQQCGECTACCVLLEITDTASKPNEVCKHCDLGVGCKIYDQRPQGCKEFMCMWLQMGYVHPDLRPDRCGLMFEKFSDEVICGVTSGHGVTRNVLGQIEAFVQEGFSVVIMNHAKRQKSFFLAKGHTRSYVDGVINGRS